MACDTKEQKFEERARHWLGETRDEFDVVFGLEKVLAVEGVVESMRKRGQQISEEEARQLYARLCSAGTQQFVYGALFIQRCGERVTQKPFRIGLTPAGNATDFERLLAWRRHTRQAGFAEWLPQARPRFAPRLQLTTPHVVQEGELVPAEFVFTIEAGREGALRPDAWVVPLLARLNGARSVAEVFEAASAAGELPNGFALSDFAELVRLTIDRGFLVVGLPS